MRDDRSRIVAALGGNALLQRGEAATEAVQKAHVRTAVAALAPLAGAGGLVVTYGDGPQVGTLAIENASDPTMIQPYAFDVLGAQVQGMLGYWLLQALHNALPGRRVASLITQTLVSAADPAFADPTKFVGSGYEEEEARRLAAKSGWQVRQDGGRWRRVVASPAPQRVVETALIRDLVDAGVVVVCAGGGGAPVVRNGHGDLEGVDAVVDKDATSGLLAEAIEADALLLLTDVSAVEDGWGTAAARVIRHTSPGELRALHFAPGSMGPKVEAVCRFAELTGNMGAIGALADATDIVSGRAGTIVTPRGAAVPTEEQPCPILPI